MNARKEKVAILCTFMGWTNINEEIGIGEHPRGGNRTLPILDHNLIDEVQDHLSGEQWDTYINELEMIMRNDVDSHLPSLKYAGLVNGKCVLMLKASADQKSDALINVLDFMFATLKVSR